MATQSIKSDALEPDLSDLRGKGAKGLLTGAFKTLPGIRVSFHHVTSHSHLLRVITGYLFHLAERSTDLEQSIWHRAASTCRDDSHGRGKDRFVDRLRCCALGSFSH